MVFRKTQKKNLLKKDTAAETKTNCVCCKPTTPAENVKKFQVFNYTIMKILTKKGNHKNRVLYRVLYMCLLLGA